MKVPWTSVSFLWLLRRLLTCNKRFLSHFLNFFSVFIKVNFSFALHFFKGPASTPYRERIICQNGFWFFAQKVDFPLLLNVMYGLWLFSPSCFKATIKFFDMDYCNSKRWIVMSISTRQHNHSLREKMYSIDSITYTFNWCNLS